jgi:hypothetical protein
VDYYVYIYVEYNEPHILPITNTAAVERGSYEASQPLRAIELLEERKGELQIVRVEVICRSPAMEVVGFLYYCVEECE